VSMDVERFSCRTRYGAGRAEQRRVTLGARGPLKAVVAAGLEAGERVVVYPGDALSSGRRVTVVPR